MKLFACVIAMVLPAAASGDDTAARCRAMLDESEYLTETDLVENKRRIGMWRSAFALCQQSDVPLDLRVRSYVQWSRWLEQQHRTADETQALEDAQHLIEREAGPDDPLLIDVLVALAGNEAEAQKRSEALRLLERAQKIRERAFGVKSESAVDGLLMLGIHHQHDGRVAVAEHYFLTAAETARAMGCRPPGCTLERLAYRSLADMLREIPGREADAKKYRDEAVKLYPRKQKD